MEQVRVGLRTYCVENAEAAVLLRQAQELYQQGFYQDSLGLKDRAAKVENYPQCLVDVARQYQ